MLRALGAWLDEERPKSFTILETADGFSVVLTQNMTGKPLLSEVHFDRQNLSEREQRMGEKRRIVGNPFGGSHDNAWGLSSSGRQDFLRALGYELDDAEAQGIILDEMEDQLLLTYSYVDPAQGYLWHKKMVGLRREEIDKILEVARERRRRERRRVLRW
jgi:hypothetical protein